MQDWIFWLGLATILIVAELAVGTFYMLLLAAGAIVALVAAVIGAPVIWQEAIFTLASFLLYVYALPVLRRFVPSSKEKVPTTTSELVGSLGYVVRPILQGEGQVRVDSDVWTAIAEDEILEGEVVEIIEVRVSKLVVKKRRGVDA